MEDICQNCPYDVFIMSCTDDDYLQIDRKVYQALETYPYYQVRCRYTVGPGHYIPDVIAEETQQARTTLLLLTEKASECNWILMAIILCMEKSHQSGRLCIRFLVFGVYENSIKKLKNRLNLPDQAYIRVDDINRVGWQDCVVDSMRDTIHMKNILPVGNLAHGQVFSHFVGYLRFILPDLQSAIQRCERYADNAHCMSTKYYILLSGECEVLKHLDEQHDKRFVIESAGTLDMPPVNHVGKQRTMNPPIYSIRKQNETEKYYFIGEFPNELGAMFRIHKFISFDMRLQIARFYITLNEVLNHMDSGACNNIVHFLPYNAKVESMANLLYDAVKYDILSTQDHSSFFEPTTLSREAIGFGLPLPAGDVATGLAWAYTIGYLPITLLDLKKRIQKHLRDKGIMCGCIPKLFILVPKRGKCQDEVIDSLNRGYPGTNVPVTSLGAIEPVTIDAAGHNNRLYMYQYTNPQTGMSVCFLCEYATPANTLYAMAQESLFTGLLDDDLYRQVEEFKSLVEKIVQRKDYKRKIGYLSHLIKLVFCDNETVLGPFGEQAGLDLVGNRDLLYV